MLEALNNRHLSCGRFVVENSFGIPKKMFKGLKSWLKEPRAPR
jgi:hypothetical protein